MDVLFIITAFSGLIHYISQYHIHKKLRVQWLTVWGHEVTWSIYDQSQASIEVTWSVWTNQSPVFRELVANLSGNMGQIYTESFPMPKRNMHRILFQYNSNEKHKMKASGPHTPPPFNLAIYKGAKAWKLPRSFVEFLLNHPVAQEFIGIYNQSQIYWQWMMFPLFRVVQAYLRRWWNCHPDPGEDIRH